MRGRMDFDLQEMLELRRIGWSFVALGKKYLKDRTTIMHHCKKHGVVAESKIIVEMDGTITEPEPEEPAPIRISKYQHLLDEEATVRAPRSYTELLKQAVKRKDSDKRHYRRFLRHGYPNLGVDRSSSRAVRLGSDHYDS